MRKPGGVVMRSWIVATFFVAVGVSPVGSPSPIGTRPVSADVVPIANLPPDCSGAVPSVADLWPPNHQLTRVMVGGVTDPDGDPVAVRITAIAQDEPLDGAGDGSSCPDAAGVGTDTASVRAERSARGDGRAYHLRFIADDGRGGTCSGEVTLCVRHDGRPGSGCGDQGALVDSTLGGAFRGCDGGVCEPEDCVPSADDLAPSECAQDALPPAVERRIARARELLERAGRRRSDGSRRLGLRAAASARKAAASAAAAARRDELSDDCATAVRQGLENAATCAACVLN
jgi:hypothetical protein